MDRYDRVLRRLDELKMSQKDLAKKIPTSAAYLNRSLKGKKGLGPHWAVLARILGVSQEWLTEGKGAARPVNELPPPQEIFVTIKAGELRWQIPWKPGQPIEITFGNP